MLARLVALLASATATFNPSDKDADITLSNGDLTATRTVAAPPTNVSVRATDARAGGGWYFEVLVNETGDFGVGDVGIGLLNASASLATYVGGDAHGVGYQDGGLVRINTTPVAALTPYTDGDRIRVAFTDDNIWFALGAGDWNDDSGADPETGVGGIDISGIAGPFYPAADMTLVGEQVTINMGGSALTYAPPAGFLAVGWSN